MEVVLTIEGKNNYEYLLFEDLKPGGLEAVQIRSGENLYVREVKSGALNGKNAALMNYKSAERLYWPATVGISGVARSKGGLIHRQTSRRCLATELRNAGRESGRVSCATRTRTCHVRSGNPHQRHRGQNPRGRLIASAMTS